MANFSLNRTSQAASSTAAGKGTGVVTTGVGECADCLEGLSVTTQGRDIPVGEVHASGHSDPGEMAKLKSMVTSYKNENTVLKQKLKEAIESKSKWQSYDRSRDDLVNRLDSEKRELQAKLSQVRPADLLSSERDDVILYWKRKAEEEEAMRKRLEDVSRSQDIFIQNLQIALQQSQKSMMEVDKERIEILENQVKIFSEDFEQERRDRERAQARVSELEEELNINQYQLSQFQSDSMSKLAARRRHTMSAYRAEYDRQLALQSSPPPNGTNSRLIPHGVYEYTSAIPEQDGGDSEEDEDIVELPMSHSSPNNKIGTLTCPKCQKHFLASDPMAFLDHNDVCV